MMPIHPAIVHVPLVLALLSPIVLIWIAWHAWRAGATRRTWAAALALQAAIVAGGLAALRTGEAEEHRVEAVVLEEHVEAHERRAQVFVVGAAAVLVLAGVGFAAPRVTRVLLPPTLLAAVVVALLGVITGHAGGELVYRHGAASVYQDGTPPPPAPREKHDED
jgi:uncharacterized membrane protein